MQSCMASHVAWPLNLNFAGKSSEALKLLIVKTYILLVIPGDDSETQYFMLLEVGLLHFANSQDQEENGVSFMFLQPAKLTKGFIVTLNVKLR